MAKSVNRKRLELRIDAFEMAISKIGYSICKMAQGKNCEYSQSSCGHSKRIKGIETCNL